MNPISLILNPSVAGSALLASLGFGFFVRDWVHRILAGRSSSALFLERYRTRLKRELFFLRARQTAEQVMLYQGICAVFGLFILLQGYWAGLGVVSLVLIPDTYINHLRKRRVAAIERQVEGWMGSLARALEAAPSIGEAFVATMMSSGSPMREEVELVAQEMELGRSFERALSVWEERVGSSVLALALSTLQIGRQTGGSLPRVLRDAAASLREMERLQGVVRTKTAEGKAQSALIAGLPIPTFFAMNWSDPTHFDPLKNTAVGHILVAVATILWLAALFSIKKILAVRI